MNWPFSPLPVCSADSQAASRASRPSPPNPALLLVGLPPVTANVTNTVALVFNGVGSVLGSRPELKGQGAWLKRIAPAAVVGGAVGAALLLSTPAQGFERVVPILLALASAAILLPRASRQETRVADTNDIRSRCC